ncbi:hypothetical protein [Escherichia coli]|nr:hypothetical protein [Escherichia coli]
MSDADFLNFVLFAAPAMILFSSGFDIGIKLIRACDSQIITVQRYYD